MNIKIKKLIPEAIIPAYAKQGDAGMDLTATSVKTVEDLYYEYGTGLAIEIPFGYVGLIFPRSSISNTDLTLANCIGVVDSIYRGELKLRFKISAEYATYLEEIEGREVRDGIYYNIGDRIGQLIILPYPQINFIQVDELSSTERGDAGFGSTNK